MRARTTKSKLSRLPATGQQQAQRLIATDERVPQSPPLCSQHQLTAQTNDPGPSLMATGGADDRTRTEEAVSHDSLFSTTANALRFCTLVCSAVSQSPLSPSTVPRRRRRCVSLPSSSIPTSPPPLPHSSSAAVSPALHRAAPHLCICRPHPPSPLHAVGARPRRGAGSRS
jgi:hypothetical protein